MAALKEAVKSLGKTMHKISNSIGSSNGSAESAVTSQSTPNASSVTSAGSESVTNCEPPTPVFSCSLQAPISYTPPPGVKDQGTIVAGRSYHVQWNPRVEGKAWVFNIHEAGSSTTRFVVPAYVFEGKFRFEMAEPPLYVTLLSPLPSPRRLTKCCSSAIAIRHRHRFGEQHIDVEKGDSVTVIAFHGQDWLVARPQNHPQGIIARHGLIPSSCFDLAPMFECPFSPLTMVDVPSVGLPSTPEEYQPLPTEDHQIAPAEHVSLDESEPPAGQGAEEIGNQADEVRQASNCPQCPAPREPHMWGFVRSVSITDSDTTDAQVFELMVNYDTCFQADPNATSTPTSQCTIHRNWSHFYAIDLVLRSKLKHSLNAGHIPPDPLPDSMSTSLGKTISMEIQIKILEKWLRQVCALGLEDSTRSILWSSRLTRFFLDPDFTPRR